MRGGGGGGGGGGNIYIHISLMQIISHSILAIRDCSRRKGYSKNPVFFLSRRLLNFDMLNVASDFGVLDDVVSMARLGHRWSKDMWKKKIWKRAWDMDECFWAIQTLCHRSLDLLSNVCGGV